jgi:hypothetical protein
VSKRPFTAPPEAERCTGNVTLSDGSGAACMHRRTAGSDRCRQHQRVYCCPFCEHMPDGAEVRVCDKHECKACAARYKSGQSGQCPACANERARTGLAAERNQATEIEGAVRLFSAAVGALRKLGSGFSLYVTNDTLCLMSGPSHDEYGQPLRDNVIASESGSGLRISGGDW